MVAPMAAGDALRNRGYRYLIQTLTPSSLYHIGWWTSRSNAD
jgi:hypothetical protein